MLGSPFLSLKGRHSAMALSSNCLPESRDGSSAKHPGLALLSVRPSDPSQLLDRRCVEPESNKHTSSSSVPVLDLGY
jgi:hypothetical protein